MKRVSCGDIEGLSVDITNNVKEVQLNLMRGKGLQLMVIVVDHGYSDHQTSQGTTNNVFLCDIIIPIATRLNFTNVMELSQFKSNIAPSKLSNPTQFEPSQPYFEMCLPSQDIECITNVNWPTINLTQELALTT
jgi:hypothetical protein